MGFKFNTLLRAILAGGGAAPVQLPQLGSLVARWSVDAITPVADGTAISSWTDSVGGLSAVQATGGKQPLYKTNRLNGKPSLLFSGGQLMTAGTPAAIVTPMTNKVITIMVIFKGVTATTYGALYSGSNALSGSWLLYADATRVGRYNGSNLSTAALHSGSGFTSIAFTMEDTTAFSSGTRQERLYINGGCVGASPAVPDGTNDSIGFGGRAADSGLNLKGEVFDYLFWNQALTPAEVATAHAWACEKYAQATPWSAGSKFYAFHGDSNYATYTDAYAPIHTNSNIGIVGACGASQPSTYFTDTIGHPTAAGYTVLAGLMTTAINALP